MSLYCDGYGNCYYSPWSEYGRWIVLAAVIIATFFLFLAFSCITARRRRRAGLHPYRFTGWAGGPGRFGGFQPYGGPQYQQAPPGYGQPAAGGPYYGNNPEAAQGYYGGQQTGIELQQPTNTYQGQRTGEPVYNAPAGAPPGKGDGGFR